MENNIKLDREDAECIDLAQNRDRWQAVGKAIVSLRLAKNTGNFLSDLSSISLSEGHRAIRYISCSVV